MAHLRKDEKSRSTASGSEQQSESPVDESPVDIRANPTLAIKLEGFHLLGPVPNDRQPQQMLQRKSSQIIESTCVTQTILSSQGIGDVSRSFLHYFPLQSQSWIGNPKSSEQIEIEWGLGNVALFF